MLYTGSCCSSQVYSVRVKVCVCNFLIAYHFISGILFVGFLFVVCYGEMFNLMSVSYVHCWFGGHSGGAIPGLVSIPEVKSSCVLLWYCG